MPQENVVGSEVPGTESFSVSIMSGGAHDVSCREVAITAGRYFRYRPCDGGNAKAWRTGARMRNAPEPTHHCVSLTKQDEAAAKCSKKIEM